MQSAGLDFEDQSATRTRAAGDDVQEQSMAAKSTSWCMTETAQGMHVFDVHRYSLLKALGLRRSVRSATFTVGGYDWAVRLYPSGVSSPPEHASVSLDLLDVPATSAADAKEARAVFALALVDQTTPGRTRSLLPGGAAKKLQTFRVAMAVHIHLPASRFMPATTSSCTTETARGVHVFQVRRYSLLRAQLGAGRFVRSGSFAVGGCDWAVRLHASGEAAARYVSVCVELLRSENAEVVTEVGVRLVDHATGRTRSFLSDAKPKHIEDIHEF
ncbi:hypothetical protein EJB05_09990, partial [Eragrostis curvula]